MKKVQLKQLASWCKSQRGISAHHHFDSCCGQCLDRDKCKATMRIIKEAQDPYELVKFLEEAGITI